MAQRNSDPIMWQVAEHSSNVVHLELEHLVSLRHGKICQFRSIHREKDATSCPTPSLTRILIPPRVSSRTIPTMYSHVFYMILLLNIPTWLRSNRLDRAWRGAKSGW